LVITYLEQPDASLTHLVETRFLVDTGPEDRLSKGSAFELLEGPRTVAEGSVVSE